MNLIVSNVRIDGRPLTDGVYLTVYLPTDMHELRAVSNLLPADVTNEELLVCCVRTTIFYHHHVTYDLSVTTDQMLYRSNTYHVLADMLDYTFDNYRRVDVLVKYDDMYVINDYNLAHNIDELADAVYHTLLERLDLQIEING